MDLTRNRSILFAAALVLGATTAGTACSATVESVSSTGTAGVGAGVEQSPPSAMPGTSAPRLTNHDPSARSATTDPPPAPSSGATSGPTFDTTTTIVDPNQLPTSPPESSTIPANGQDPVLVDCGVLYRAAGWPTTFVPSTAAITCLQDAFAAGTPARLVDRAQTDGEGGAILVTTYDVLGPSTVRVSVDAREAADRPQGISISRCTGLVTEFVTITTSGCVVVG